MKSKEAVSHITEYTLPVVTEVTCKVTKASKEIGVLHHTAISGIDFNQTQVIKDIYVVRESEFIPLVSVWDVTELHNGKVI